MSEGKSFKLLPHLAPTKRLFVGLAKNPEKEEIKKKKKSTEKSETEKLELFSF